MVKRVFHFATPRKGANIIGTRRSWTISDVQHHELDTATDITMLCILVPAQLNKTK